jgi:CheY-like chemotaxis protein
MSMPADTRSLRVLVVDDNEDAARTLATLVGLWGYEARAVLSGASALTEAADFRPDVVLCDLSMPGVDGCHVAEGLRRHAAHAGILLVAVTAYGDEGHRQRAAYAGFHAHLVKPVEEEGLRRLLESHVGNL